MYGVSQRVRKYRGKGGKDDEERKQHSLAKMLYIVTRYLLRIDQPDKLCAAIISPISLNTNYKLCAG